MHYDSNVDFILIGFTEECEQLSIFGDFSIRKHRSENTFLVAILWKIWRKMVQMLRKSAYQNPYIRSSIEIEK